MNERTEDIRIVVENHGGRCNVEGAQSCLLSRPFAGSSVEDVDAAGVGSITVHDVYGVEELIF